MKITIANHGIHPLQIGGMERHTYNLAKSLHDLGKEVEVLVPDFSSSTNESPTFPFPVRFLPWGNKPLWLWANFEFSKHVAEHVKRTKPDVILSQGFNAWAALKKPVAPILYHPHGLEMFGDHLSLKEYISLSPFRAAVRYHAKHAERVVSLGGRLTDILFENASVPRKKIVEIPNAIFPDQFPIGRAEVRKPRSFLFVGRLAFNKGIDFLPKVLSVLSGENFSLTIVGQGPEQAKVMRLCEKDPRVVYKFGATDEELRDLYRTHECLLFMSRFEGMPTVILEAMSCGMLVIATKVGAVEAILDPSMAYLVQPNAAEIADAIQSTLRLSTEQKSLLREKLVHRVNSTFSWPEVTKKFIKLFEEMA